MTGEPAERLEGELLDMQEAARIGRLLPRLAGGIESLATVAEMPTMMVEAFSAVGLGDEHIWLLQFLRWDR